MGAITDGLANRGIKANKQLKNSLYGYKDYSLTAEKAQKQGMCPFPAPGRQEACITAQDVYNNAQLTGSQTGPLPSCESRIGSTPCRPASKRKGPPSAFSENDAVR